ncbi:hypothetical protein MJO29_003693 [Puccinia striiformis f. sp. tritici]|uniref:Alkyl hydroperoxide reductase subunit C/ Thiol specific antioxidant domain-containing protein n=1 Tax=Puccinia striiformis f. sp. tritici PST-78 TaxID=1165861 RepID=A0A0L0V7N0_9BASI|nr:hypothetical protein Pst134EA_006795 [Puccinia striiformis f. sp. tritici]KAI9616772.1 hypothetical protein KEM48_005012 [Puccinia striiformis f. sp. tritici PST-130]KNE95287.1 hypothetical protein PSTG_11372 [Puccinia striiformis f. sp. tritici PST-78]KAH9459727.1 hypothetical protein Pst134EB_007957 [Puccinia striiformis f. sp. tritici]KAH9469503.1 hypothetical protein Pst134EA_006795 [Puccinia striiformis f. sp. tritici]KAI7963169.1 hypothetical protein MJO29_003596 [Puccinia striiformis
MSTISGKEDVKLDSKTVEVAGMIGVFDQEGNERPFGGLIRHGKVCVIFIRHFLCGYCQDYLTALKDKVSDNHKIIVIGCGHWSVIKSYKELLVDCPFEIYSESTGNLSSSLGMIVKFDTGDPKTQGQYITQSLKDTILGAFVNGWKMGTSSFIRSGKMAQLGGEFIFLDGKCVLAHRMKTARDHLEPDELLERFEEF